VLRQRAPGCGEDNNRGNEEHYAEEKEGQDVLGHVGDRPRVMHEVVEEHRREVWAIDVEVEVVKREFLRDDEGEDCRLECD